MNRASPMTAIVWDRPRSIAGWMSAFLWAIYLASYPIAVVGVAFDVRPGFSMAWAGSILLFLQGGMAVAWFWQTLGARRGALAAGIVALGAFAGETLGVATGVPFGSYQYTATLFPRLPGSVPLPVIGAWLLVVSASVGTAQLLWPRAPIAVRVALAALLGVVLDLILEPVAARVEHYWVWQATGPWYGIPITNFLGWIALCGALAAMVFALWRPSLSTRHRIVMSRGASPLAETPFWLYALTAAMFTVVDLAHGLWGATGIGIVSLCALAYRLHTAYDKG
jgi:uncharacterized membrane protein